LIDPLPRDPLPKVGDVPRGTPPWHKKSLMQVHQAIIWMVQNNSQTNLILSGSRMKYIIFLIVLGIKITPPEFGRGYLGSTLQITG